MEKTMVIDTNEYRSMVKKTDPKPAAAAPPEPASEPPSGRAPTNNKKKKKVRGYLTYMAGGEGTLALKQKVIKIGKIAATISRTRDGYFFSSVSGFAKSRVNNKTASKKPQKLN